MRRPNAKSRSDLQYRAAIRIGIACLALAVPVGCKPDENHQNPPGARDSGRVEATKRNNSKESTVRRTVRDRSEAWSLANKLSSGELGVSDFWKDQVEQVNLVDLMAALIEIDPTLCLELIDAAPDVLKSNNARRSFVQARAETDPVGAFMWIGEQELSDLQKGALIELLIGRADFEMRDGADPSGWLALLRAVRRNPHWTRPLETQIAMSLGANHPLREARKTLEAAGPLSTNAHTSLLRGALEYDVSSVKRYLAEHPEVENAWFAAGGEVQVARRLARDSPKEAFGWALGLQRNHPQAAERAIREVMPPWLSVDAVGASQQIGSLPGGGAKDAAIEAMAKWLHHAGSSEEIRPWIGEVESERIRSNLIEMMGE